MPVGVSIAALTGGILAHAGVITVSFLGGGFLAGAVLYGGIAAASFLIQKAFAPDLNLERGAGLRRAVRSEVAPARWIVGRARVGGDLVYISDEPGEPRYEWTDANSRTVDDSERFLRMVLVLSEGPVEAIERLWIDGIEEHFEWSVPVDPNWHGYATRGEPPAANVMVPRTRGADYDPNDTSTKSRFAGKIGGHADGSVYRIHAFLAGDGVHPITLEKPEWLPARHKLEGLAYVFIELFQPGWTDPDDRVWTRIPNLEFLVKGIKVRRPAAATGSAFVTQWTDNAISLYYWFLVERMGVPESKIDRASFMAAYSYAGATVDASPDNLPPGYGGYATSYPRYSGNGVVLSSDEPSRVMSELDFATAGQIVEIDGIVHFRPGQPRPLGRALTSADLVRVEGWQPGPELQDRVNTASMKLDQSSDLDWTEQAVPEVVDAASVARDGAVLTADLGTRAFVASPLAALRLAIIALARQRYAGIYTLRLRPGAGFANHGLSPGDRHPVTIEEIGLDALPCEVQSTTVHDDMSVTVVLRHAPTWSIFQGIADNHRLWTSLPPRPVPVGPIPEVLGALSSMDAVAVVRQTVGSNVEARIDVTWTPTLPVSILVEGPGGFRSRTVSGGGSEQVPVVDEGEYTVTVRRISGARVGPPSTATVTIDFDVLSGGAIAGFTVVPYAEIKPDGSILSELRIAWSNPSGTTTVVDVTGPAGFRQQHRTGSAALTVAVPGEGRYTVVAFFRTAVDGPRSTVTVDLSWAGLAPGYRIVPISITQHGSILHIVAEPITDPAFVGVDLKFKSATIGPGAVPGTIDDEAGWAAASRMGVSAVVPSLRGHNAFIEATIPFSAFFHLYARSRNRAGLVGPISDLGSHLLVLPPAGTGTLQSAPLWEGFVANVGVLPGPRHVLVLDQDPSPDTDATYDAENRQSGGTVMARRRWNGNAGWPFGPHVLPAPGSGIGYGEEGHWYYSTPWYDLGKEGRFIFRVRPELYVPPDAATQTGVAVSRRIDTVVYYQTEAQRAAGTRTRVPLLDTSDTSLFETTWTGQITARYVSVTLGLLWMVNCGVTGLAVDYQEA